MLLLLDVLAYTHDAACENQHDGDETEKLNQRYKKVKL